MINDMIALASSWEDRLRPPKCDKKEDSQDWDTSFPHLLTLTQKEKNLNRKAMNQSKASRHFAQPSLSRFGEKNAKKKNEQIS